MMRRCRALDLVVLVVMLAIGLSVATASSPQQQGCLQYVSPPIPVAGWSPPSHLPSCAEVGLGTQQP